MSGAIAQLGERLPCTQEVGGSIPPGSTNFWSHTLFDEIKEFEGYGQMVVLICSLTIWKISDVLSG